MMVTSFFLRLISVPVSSSDPRYLLCYMLYVISFDDVFLYYGLIYLWVLLG